jgi:uncharacterized iron-regulated membrane protein
VALLRRVIFWCHLVAGVVAGSIVLIMSVTGVLLTYEKQMATWADLRPFRNPPPPGAVRLAPDAIVAAVQRAYPEAAPTTMTAWADPSAPASVVIAGPRTILVNPYTAQVLGEPGRQPRAFFRKMTDWHRWLGATTEGRATGRAITGACNLAFLFLVVSGFYLWFPRTWTWRQVRAVLWFRGGLRGKARDFNWHNAIGLWSAVPLFIVVLSGAVISYPWAGDLVYRAAGETPPARPAPAAPRPAAPATATDPAARPAPVASLDALWARAEGQVDGWRTITARLPAPGSSTAVFTIDRGTAGQPQKRGTLTMNTRTAEVTKWEPFSALSTGRRWRSYLRFAHTGEIAGLAGQTIAGLASLGGAVLVYTGISLAIRRLWAWRARRAALATAPVRPREDMLDA